jgi:DNA-binding YbaB/EbfC family protein
MNIRQLMKQAQEMQEKMQRELEEMELEASVGGGMVTVKMTGKKIVTGVKIDPEILDPNDPTLVEDLVLAAINQVSRQVDEELQGKLGGLATSMPGLF